MKKLFLLFVILFAFKSINAQLVWQKTYGGSGHEYCWKTIPTSDGGLAFVGFSESNNGDVSGNHGNNDLWVAKIDATGNIQWSYLYGGTEDDQGYDIFQTADNGFLVVGWTDSFDGDVSGHHGSYDSDVWVLKLTSSGSISWSKCYGGTYGDEAMSVAQAQSGDFFVAGSTYSNDGDVSGNHSSGESDFWVIKINSTGTLLNQVCIGGTDYDEGVKMISTADGGCIIVGRTSSADLAPIGYHGGADMLVAKLSASLTIEWSKCYGGTQTEEANAVVQLSDGSYAVLGYTSTQNNGDVTGHHGSQGSDDFWLLKLTTTGAITWAKCYGGDGDDQANGLTITSTAGFVMCGLTNSTNGDVSGFHSGGFFDPDIWVAKVDASGNLLGQRCCGGSGQDESFNVYEETPGVYVVTGFTYSGDYDVTMNRGSADGWILKVTPLAAIDENIEKEQLKVYPVPATELLNVEFLSDRNEICTIIIRDISGRELAKYYYNIHVGINKMKSDIKTIESGLYNVVISTGQYIYSGFFTKR